jgi:leucyl-tRNA synthetase
MNRGINQTDINYRTMMFKEALRTGFFEYQDARDKYRELSSSSGMHRDLVLKFIETQTIILCPICPHTSEYIWTEVLKNSGTVNSAKWPEVKVVDEVLLQSFSYLIDASHSFRLRLKSFFTQGKGKDKKKEVIVKPTHATIYIAKKFPTWQSIVLTNMKALYSEHNKKLPENSVIAAKLSKIADLKKYIKKVMPFAEARKVTKY